MPGLQFELVPIEGLEFFQVTCECGYVQKVWVKASDRAVSDECRVCGCPRVFRRTDLDAIAKALIEDPGTVEKVDG
jgi:hypothetical protein